MIRKTGKVRTPFHDLKLAAFVTTTAGIINVSSLLAFFVLTTNVTGHMAILSEAIVSGDIAQVFVLLIYLFMFIAGAFFSMLIMLVWFKKTPKRASSLALAIEALLIIMVGSYGVLFFQGKDGECMVLSALLLFAMGLQNALVTYISKAAVRSTHLTGVFTDLGIELAEYFSASPDKRAVVAKLKLRFTILFFYGLGGIIGGYVYMHYTFGVFFLAAGIIVYILLEDLVKVMLLKRRRKLTVRMERARLAVLRKIAPLQRP